MASQAPNPLVDPRLAATGLRASSVTGAIGVVCLFAMYAAFGVGARSTALTVGWISDVSGIVTMPLALPGMLALHVRIGPHAGRAGDALLVLGVGSSAAISVLQLLLVGGALPFEQEIGPVTVAYLCLGAWFVLTGRMAQRDGVLSGGTRLGVLAAAFAGYPVWALRLARALETEPAMAGEAATA
jgi:hypothetical protein